MTDRRGIEIDPDVAQAAALPEDLNANVVGVYTVPNTDRRKWAGLVYLAAAAGVALAITQGLPTGMWLIVGLFVAIGVHHIASGWDLKVRETEALDLANKVVGFGVGHASAQLTFQGFRARPIWNVLVFSADEPPTRRALVRINALSGEVIEQYAEPVPEGELS
ncbi:MAG TPA: hypothetical protein ENG98_03685 [Actinobacteria bacterium]|nr:hypothetical protein BMS3Bbin02_00925 [bacterium BMS3Bbin02]HDL42093.1 hypothetical protein [Actinomycetota bacterium]